VAPVVHRLWLGPKPMPARYVEYAVAWISFGFDVQDWTRETLEMPLVNQEVFDRIAEVGANSGPATMPPEQAIAVQQADVVGYELIHRYGGIYVNCDMQPVRSFDRVFAEADGRAFAGYEDDEFIVNSLMGGPPGHPFWEAVIEELPQRYHRMPGALLNQQTGPHLLTDVARRWSSDAFVAFPREYFNPVHHGEIHPGGWVTNYDIASHPDTFCLHHWGHRLSADT
jgi:inositol phosphorylceramide mannosyltransferase catalytic subunit